MYLRTFCAVSLLALAGCASRPNPGDGVTASPQMRADDAQLQTYRIDNWSVSDDRTLLIESTSGEHYRARLSGYCPGLRFTQSLGFLTRGGFNTIDQFAGVVLPDGTRCSFQSFEKLDFPNRASGEKEREEKQDAPDQPATQTQDESAEGTYKSRE